ncbi:middle T antigen [Alphapolyomavirus aflavicollis]|uniref:Middle T antigen n=1 Tax=Alphapolyomavirus aflavicollis TaxID=2170408 RepID=A0A2S1CJG7_9POLY|nr:middle T antigen [Alphapolyomavirus aflavicollis]AWD33693.1 middle T antigen [Alphapolyomavirus aflavicollis]
MDRILSKEEKAQLLVLLDLEGQYWGDFGRMQKAYHAQSLKFHPDKGGDPVLMQLLNTLWTKLKHGLHQVRIDLGSHEVRRLAEGDWWLSTRQTFGNNYYRRLCRMPITCLQNKNCSTCTCLLCTLRRQHRGIKKACLAPCLVLGQCYCLDCFSLWFGLPVNNFILLLYADFLGEVPIDWLDINVHQIYNPNLADNLPVPSSIQRRDITGHMPMDLQDTARTRESGGRSSSISGTVTSTAVRNWGPPMRISHPPPPLFLFPRPPPLQVHLGPQEHHHHHHHHHQAWNWNLHHQVGREYMEMNPATMEENIYEEIAPQEEPIYQNIQPIYLQLLPEHPNQPLVRITTPQRNLRLVRENSNHPRRHLRNRLLIGILLMICLLCCVAISLMLYTLIRHRIAS